MKIKLILSSALMILTGALAANAQRTPIINQREHHQVNRINNGVNSGRLTHSESAHLRAREQNIRADKRIAKRTGTLSPAKRANLRARESRLSNSIYRKKHNGRSY